MYFDLILCLDSVCLVLSLICVDDVFVLFVIQFDFDVMCYWNYVLWMDFVQVQVQIVDDFVVMVVGMQFKLVICDSVYGLLLGICVVFVIDVVFGCVEIGYNLVLQVQGKGYMCEVLMWLVIYLFDECGLCWFEVEIDLCNVVLVMVLEWIGF